MSNPCEAECSDCFEHSVLNGLLFSFFALCDVTEQISEQLHLLDVQTFLFARRSPSEEKRFKGRGVKQRSLFQPEDEFRGQTKVPFMINNDSFEL